MNDCVLWQWKTDRQGYGHINIGGRWYFAHRLTYEAVNGPIPEGLVIDHLCRTPTCILPEHLEVVTRRENTLRGETLAAANAAKTHCYRGHPLTDVVMDGRKRRCRECRRIRQRVSHKAATTS